MLAHQMREPIRDIAYRTSGYTHGPITRLVSPSDLGGLIKPFVFLDRFDFDGQDAPLIGAAAAKEAAAGRNHAREI